MADIPSSSVIRYHAKTAYQLLLEYVWLRPELAAELRPYINHMMDLADHLQDEQPLEDGPTPF
jgi:hypothetical protein